MNVGCGVHRPGCSVSIIREETECANVNLLRIVKGRRVRHWHCLRSGDSGRTALGPHIDKLEFQSVSKSCRQDDGGCRSSPCARQSTCRYDVCRSRRMHWPVAHDRTEPTEMMLTSFVVLVLRLSKEKAIVQFTFSVSDFIATGGECSGGRQYLIDFVCPIAIEPIGTEYKSNPPSSTTFMAQLVPYNWKTANCTIGMSPRPSCPSPPHPPSSHPSTLLFIAPPLRRFRSPYHPSSMCPLPSSHLHH